jgi:DNA repair exonuclease SbcCD ATPase subunit
MGRINKRSEAALKAAAEMLETTKNQSIRAQLIRNVLDYELRQQERADASKAGRRKGAEHKELAELRSKVQDLIDELGSAEASKAKEISDLRSQLRNAEQSASELQREVMNAKQEAEEAHKEIGKMQECLNFANGIIEHFAPALPPERRYECAAELFQKFKSDAPELLAQLFKSMGLDLKSWHSWDAEYSENSELMVEAFACPEKHEAGKLPLLRLKLSAMGIDVDAINAVRDYRDLKINFAELEKRTHHITFMHGLSELRRHNRIPANLMPRLTEDALRTASQKMHSDPARKLEWLEVVEKLLQCDDGIGSLLLKEKAATRRAAEKF